MRILTLFLLMLLACGAIGAQNDTGEAVSVEVLNPSDVQRLQSELRKRHTEAPEPRSSALDAIWRGLGERRDVRPFYERPLFIYSAVAAGGGLTLLLWGGLVLTRPRKLPCPKCGSKDRKSFKSFLRKSSQPRFGIPYALGQRYFCHACAYRWEVFDSLTTPLAMAGQTPVRRERRRRSADGKPPTPSTP
jgi:hypothetical protein